MFSTLNISQSPVVGDTVTFGYSIKHVVYERSFDYDERCDTIIGLFVREVE